MSAYTPRGRSCHPQKAIEGSVDRARGMSLLWIGGRGFEVVLLVALLFLFKCPAMAMEQGPHSAQPPVPGAFAPKKSMIEARFAYLWAFSELRLREGDNYLTLPGKRNVDFPSLTFELQGETFLRNQLAVRGQAWVNVPEKFRNDFFFEGARAWDTRAGYMGADLAAIYHVGHGPMPVRAGILIGYRFNMFNLLSQRVADPSQTFSEFTQVHIPYLGVYYADLDFKGMMLRLDVAASALTLARVDANRKLNTGLTEFEGHAVTGNWFEGLFQVAFPISDSALGGIYGRYNMLNLSGGITAKSARSSTRFSMDSRFHLITVGITATYLF